MYTVYTYMYWLVASTPLKNMSSSIGMMKFPTEWKVIKAMFQPTNQCVYIYILYAYNLSPYIIYIHYHLSPYIYIIYIHYIHIHTLSYIMEQQHSCLKPPTSIYIYIISYIYNTYTLIYHISSTYTDIYSSIQKSTFTLLPAWSGGFVITSAKLPVKLPAMKLNSTSTAKIRATLRRRYSFAFIWVCLKIVYP